MKERIQYYVLALFILISFVSGRIGSFFVFHSLDGWFAQLQRPVFAPPNWLFPVVWSILYFFIALASWIGWKNADKTAAARLTATFLLTLLLKITWTHAFFYRENIVQGLWLIAAVWISTLMLAWQAWRIKRIAGALLIPQILWLSYALCLNFAYWQLNG